MPKKQKTAKERQVEARTAKELRTKSLTDKLAKDKRYRTTDMKISNKLQDEGYAAVEGFNLQPEDQMTNIFNVDAKQVSEERCEECDNHVCTCPKKTKASEKGE